MELHNHEFNTAVQNLIGDIFQTQSEGPIGYVSAREFRSHPIGWKPNEKVAELVSNQIDCPADQLGRFSVESIGQYERVVFSALAWGQYSTYVLTGEMGSGKTATVKHIADFLKRPRSKMCQKCKVCEPVLIEFNFNRGFNDKNPDTLAHKFRQRLYSSMRYHLKRIFKKGGMVDSFIQEVSTTAVDEVGKSFDLFVEQAEEDPGFRKLAQSSKAVRLLKFVDEYPGDHLIRLELMAHLAGFVKRSLRPDPACFVLILDNIDSVLAEAQYEILVDVLALQTIARIKCLITLRRATFERLNNQAAYSFGVINHSGPDVLEIVKRRVSHHLNTWNTNPIVRSVDKKFSKSVRERLGYLDEVLRDNLVSAHSLHWLSGSSIRLGLYLAERIFVNNVIAWEKLPRNTSEVLLTVYAGKNERGEITIRDKAVVNLFADPVSGEPSLLGLRIVQTLWVYRDSPQKRATLNLINILRATGNWTGGQIRSSLNYLLFDKRPLVWADGKSQYETVREMQGADILYLTDAGVFYFEKLIREIRYVQQALFSLRWQGLPEDIGSGLGTITQRLRMLRFMLRRVLDIDFDETVRFFDWNNRTGAADGVTAELVSNRIAYSIGKSALNILMTLESDDAGRRSLAEEARDWSSFLGLAYSASESFSCPFEKIDRLRERFEWAAGRLESLKKS